MELLPIAAIVLLFWFLLIRPESKRRRKVAEMQSQLRVGDAVLLTAGIFGTITRIEEETAKISVEISEGVEIDVARAAIGGIQDDGLGAEDEDRDADDLDADDLDGEQDGAERRPSDD